MTRNSWFHYLILFLGIICISWSAIFVKLADVSGLSSAFYRMFIGFLGVLPIWFLRKKTIPSKKTLRIAINYAMAYMPPTIASVSLLSQSVFTAIIAIPVLGEKLTKIEIFGAVIVLAGIFLVNKKMFKRKVAVKQEYD